MAEPLELPVVLKADEKASLPSFNKFLSAASKLAERKFDKVVGTKSFVPKDEKDWDKYFDSIKAASSKLALNPFKFEDMRKEFEKYTNEASVAGKKAKALNDKLRDGEKKGISKDLKERYEKELTYQRHLMRKATLQAGKITGKEIDLQVKRKGLLDEFDTLSKKSWDERIEEGAAKTKGLFNELRGANLGLFSDVFKGVGKATARRGAALKREHAGGGGTDKVMSGLGSLLGTLGPILLSVGALVGAFTAVLGIIMAADSHVKEMNRSLLDSGVTISDLTADTQSFESVLTAVGTAAENMSENLVWGTNAKEQMEIIAAYQQGGFSIREMVEQQRNFRDVTASALTYAKLLGVAAPEMATQQAKMMEDWSLSLESVQDQFSLIYQAARESSFGTKRFYSMVLNVTSGMAGYNVRVAEASALLLRLSKVMSPEKAQQFMQGLIGKHAQMGTLDRIKDILVIGPEKMSEALIGSARNEADFFIKNVGKKLGVAQKAMGEIGLDIDLSGLGRKEDQDKVLKQLANMTVAQRESFEGILLEEDPELFKLMQGVIGASKGMKKDRDSQVEAMDFTGVGSELVLELEKVEGIIGKRLHEITDAKERAFAEQELGKVGLDYKATVDVSRAMSSSWKRLQGTKGDKDIQKLLEGVKKGDSYSIKKFEELQKKQIAAHGATIDEEGKVISAAIDENGQIVTGGPLNSLNDYIRTRGEALQKAVIDKQDENLQAAKRIADSTTDMAKRLQIGVEAMLSKIYRLLEPALSVIQDLLLSIAETFGYEARSTLDTSDLVKGYTDSIDRTMEETRKQQAQVESTLRNELKKLGEINREENPDAYVAQEKVVSNLQSNSEVLGKQMAALSESKTQLLGLTTREKYDAFSEEMTKKISDAKDEGVFIGKENLYALMDPVQKFVAGAESDLKGEANVKYQGAKGALPDTKEARALAFVSSALGKKEIRLTPETTEFQKKNKTAKEQVLVLPDGDQALDTIISQNNIIGNLMALGKQELPKGSVNMSKGEMEAYFLERTKGKLAEGASPEDIKKLYEEFRQEFKDFNNLHKVQDARKAIEELEGSIVENEKKLSEAQTQEEKDSINKQIEKDKEALEINRKNEETFLEKLAGKEAKDIALEMESLQRKQRTEEFVSLLERYGGDIPGEIEILAKRIRVGEKLTQVVMRGKLESLSPEKQKIFREKYPDVLDKLGITNAEDFIWRPGSPPLRFNSADEIVGAKKGGAIDRALGGGALAGGGPVNINIYGDEAKVYRVVKRVLTELKMV